MKGGILLFDSYLEYMIIWNLLKKYCTHYMSTWRSQIVSLSKLSHYIVAKVVKWLFKYVLTQHEGLDKCGLDIRSHLTDYCPPPPLHLVRTLVPSLVGRLLSPFVADSFFLIFHPAYCFEKGSRHKDISSEELTKLLTENFLSHFSFTPQPTCTFAMGNYP